MKRDPDGRKLPNGVIFDPERTRYRVRLYCNHRVVWLSYARSYVEAITQYRQAKERQRYVRTHKTTIRGATNYIFALQQDLI